MPESKPAKSTSRIRGYVHFSPITAQEHSEWQGPENFPYEEADWVDSDNPNSMPEKSFTKNSKSDAIYSGLAPDERAMFMQDLRDASRPIDETDKSSD